MVTLFPTAMTSGPGQLVPRFTVLLSTGRISTGVQPGVGWPPGTMTVDLVSMRRSLSRGTLTGQTSSIRTGLVHKARGAICAIR